jgi:hypothetical protein
MRILFDHGAPHGLARELVGHTVTAANTMGWDRLSNGDLLKAAEETGFDLLLTTDHKIRYQQNLTGRKIRHRRLRWLDEMVACATSF